MSFGNYKKGALAIFILGMIVSALILHYRKPLKGSSATAVEMVSIERLFREVIVYDNFGYTLFGDKPVSVCGYFDPLPIENWDRTRNNCINEIINAGWAAWKSHFPERGFRDYLFFEELNTDPSLKTVTLVNKRAFINIVDRYRHVFEYILKRPVSGQALLDQLEHHSSGLFDLLNHHEGLYGIVLGYGIENAFLFQRRKDLNIYNPCPTFSLSNSLCSKKFLSLKEEIQFFKGLGAVAGEDLLCPITLPVFLGIKTSNESRALMKQYRKTRKQLIEIFYSDDFINRIMRQLGAEKTME